MIAMVGFSLSLLWMGLLASITAATQTEYSHMDTSVKRAHNASLLWGTYRPNLYFGARSRTPETVLAGLMWFGISNLASKPWDNIRHSCEQDAGLAGYAWNKHSGRNFGDQTIIDKTNNVSIRTQFLKSADGTDWTVRISGTPLPDSTTADISLLFYAGLDGQGEITLDSYKTPSHQSDTDEDHHNRIARPLPLMVNGHTPLLGNFGLVFHQDPASKNAPPPISSTAAAMNLPDLRDPVLIKLALPEDQVWNIKDHVRNLLIQNAQTLISTYSKTQQSNIPLQNLLHLGKNSPLDAPGNIALYQQTFRSPFSIDIAFLSNPDTSHKSPISREDIDSSVGSKLSHSLINAESQFDVRFENTFHLAERGFSESEIGFGKMLLSNMIGGMGYFHGTSMVDRAWMGLNGKELIDYLPDEDLDDGEEDDYFEGSVSQAPRPNPKLEGPTSLFTDVPSRPFFPRGFFWDSGFHQHLIGVWDNDLSLDVIQSWASLIDEDGWVAREQILGDEPRSKVPEEFQIQYPHFANPPTLITALMRYMNRLKTGRNSMESGDSFMFGGVELDNPLFLANYHITSKHAATTYLGTIYPSFKRQYQWFRRMQWGQITEWGRSSTSQEAYRWRGRKGIHTLTSGLDDYPRSTEPHAGELHVDLLCWMALYSKTLGAISQELGMDEDAALFDKQHKDMLLSLEELHWDESSQTYTDLSVNAQGQSYHVVHKGYISLFPMMLGLLEHDSQHLGAILDLVESERDIWTPYGIASLSKSDPYFGTGENYWRGPIWINMNYLTLQSLFKNYMNKPGPYQQQAQRIYKNLRANVIKNVHEEYVKTGYVWEQYGATHGEGKRSHPFTGWTALVLLIMSEDY
ncbi:hypothetical protein BDV3_006485 [Batrachochytrium dendrobatidis]